MGLVVTNSIRDGQSREVIKRVVNSCTLIDVWADEEWVNDGAAVRVSLVCFSAKQDDFEPLLNGEPVSQIFSDFTASSETAKVVDLTTAQPLYENRGTAFTGTSKKGLFEVSGEIARQWLRQPTVGNQPNSAVLKHFSNGMDITRRSRDF